MEVGDFHQVRTVYAKSAPTSSAVFDDRLDRIEQQISALFKNRSRKNSLQTDRNSVIDALSLGLRRNFVWTFVIADVNCAIIGFDFLQHFDSIVDMKRRKLIDRATLLESKCHAPQRKINAILSYDTSNQYATLLHEYRDLATISNVRKSKWRVVTVRRLPSTEQRNRAGSISIPYILDVTSILYAIITPFGLFEFLFMTFGLRNAAQTFQRHINDVIQGLDFVFAYIDDILIASESEAQHETHLRTIFDRIRKAHLTVNFEKCHAVKHNSQSWVSFCKSLERKTTWLIFCHASIPLTSTRWHWNRKTMRSNKQLYCHVTNNNTRPSVPRCLRQIVAEALHSLSHPGVKATNKLVGKHYVWPLKAKDVAKIVRSCIPCQKAKIQRHTKSPLGEYTASDARFEHINIDIVGPLPSSNGYRYCLTCIDRFSRWPAAIPLVDITAQSLANALISGWFAQYVFVRVDRMKTPLAANYEGPFEVVKKHDKYITLKGHTKDNKVSIDRLKPAYIFKDETPPTQEQTTAPTAQTPEKVSRSGR
ncbi:uncharacterized protein [Drosophila bipectinata]|uniref:uncharacterized protein n=1 Tax=Drosophila bipectinata TaxID=42026 RepID=UPI0038B236E0